MHIFNNFNANSNQDLEKEHQVAERLKACTRALVILGILRLILLDFLMTDVFLIIFLNLLIQIIILLN